MGTSNFLLENATAIYAVNFLEYADNDESDQWSWWWNRDELADFIKDRLETGVIKIKGQVFNLARNIYDGNRVNTSCERNFHEFGLCGFTFQRDYMMRKGEYISVEIDIGLLCRTGYYEGCNVDYVITVNVDGVNMDWERDRNGNGKVLDYFKYAYRHYGISPEKASQLDMWIDRWVNSHAIAAAEKYVNNMLSDCFETYRIAAKFSNGETLYEKVA